MAGPLNDNEFGAAPKQPSVDKAFTPLSPIEPTQYDPGGQQKHMYSDVPWRVRMGRMRPKAWRGETYISDTTNTAGYNRQALNSVFDD